MVEILLLRRHGAPLERFGPAAKAVLRGTVLTLHETMEGKRVPVLSISGVVPSPKLYDPRVRRIYGNEHDYLGWENEDGRWVMQEWRCTFWMPPRPADE